MERISVSQQTLTTSEQERRSHRAQDEQEEVQHEVVQNAQPDPDVVRLKLEQCEANCALRPLHEQSHTLFHTSHTDDSSNTKLHTVYTLDCSSISAQERIVQENGDR